MSVELQTNQNGVTLTRFSGGTDRGVCVQLTENITTFDIRGDIRHGFIRLTREEAAIVGCELIAFSEGRETTIFDPA